MRVIYKITIDKFEPVTELGIPVMSRMLHVGNQHEKIAVWYECNPNNDIEKKRFISVNTGDVIPDNCDFLGTVILHGGVYVRHVYVSKT